MPQENQLFNFWESLFGVSFNRDGRQIDLLQNLLPKTNQIWGVKTAVWIDTNDAWRLFVEIPELRAVIDKRASMMASNVPSLYDKNGNEVTKHWLLDLIKKPNPTQSWSDVVYSIGVQDALYSNTFLYAPERSFKIRNLLIPLPSNKIKINTTGRTLKQMDQDGLIQNFTFQYDSGEKETFEVDEIIYLATADGMNLINPDSRIDSLKYPLSNLKASYHKRNVLLENIGAIGILSAEQNDMGGVLPMDAQTKKAMQRDWYRRSKDELIITEASVKWTPMSYPTKDLLLFEEMTADKLAIIDTFGLNANLFSSEKGSTFSNVRDSIRMVYTDTIQPETQQVYDNLMQQFGLADEGYRLVAEFDHLPIMQSDAKQEAETDKLRAETFEKLVGLGVNLTEEEIRTWLGMTKKS
jgi:HK97 family phage portal protein